MRALLPTNGAPMSKSKMPPSPHTRKDIKHLAGEGLSRPSSLNAAQVRELAASVMAHIEPRGKPRPGGGKKGR